MESLWQAAYACDACGHFCGLIDMATSSSWLLKFSRLQATTINSTEARQARKEMEEKTRDT